jgi:hypothetical protein
MASMKLKAGAFQMGPGLSPSMVASHGTQSHHFHGLAGQGEGDVPGRSRGGIGKRYGKRSAGFRGLGAEVPETILTTSTPVKVYVGALQTLFGMPEAERNGVWNFATHEALIEWAAGIYGVEDKSRFPGWREDPGFTAFFAIEMFFGGFDLSSAFEQMRPFYSALGLPTTSMRDAIQAFTSVENAPRMRFVLDAVSRYIIGCEGGRAYGDPMTKYKGWGSAAADVVLPLVLVALL